MTRSIRESLRERDLRNQCVGLDIARDVLVQEWKAAGFPTPESAIWQRIEKIDEAGREINREWRKLQTARFKEAQRRRRAARKEK